MSKKEFNIQNLEVITCPHCGEKLKLEDLVVKNTLDLPVTFDADILNDAQILYCPTCQLKIPRSYLKYPSIFVSFYGVTRAGKSHILSMMTTMFNRYHPDYNFIDIKGDRSDGGENSINYWWHKNLERKLKDGEVIPPTKFTGTGNVPYDTCDNGKLCPKPFIFELRLINRPDSDNSSQNGSKRETLKTESVSDLISQPYNSQSADARETFSLQRGVYLIFQDIAGEFLTGDKEGKGDTNKKKIIEDTQWPFSTPGQFRLLIYDPYKSNAYIEYHNEQSHNKDNQMVFGSKNNQDGTPKGQDNPNISPIEDNPNISPIEDNPNISPIGNEANWDFLPDDLGSAQHRTMVVVSKFDEFRVDFEKYLEKRDRDSENQDGDCAKFKDLFVHNKTPQMEDVRYFSLKLRAFLEKEVNDHAFMGRLGDYKDVLFVPISAMGCKSEDGENFKERNPIWTEVPMQWIIDILEKDILN